jgi:hypothetical protein
VRLASDSSLSGTGKPCRNEQNNKTSRCRYIARQREDTIVAAVWIYQTDERFVAFILLQNFPDFEGEDKAKTLSGHDGLETKKKTSPIRRSKITKII